MTAWSDAALAYMVAHAIEPAVAAGLGVREEGGALVYPCDGYERRRPLSGDRTLQPRGVAFAPWWPTGRPDSAGTVLVCEGESDALAALSALPQTPLAELHELAVVAVPGAGFPADRLVDELAQTETECAYLAFDADDAGRRGCEKVADALRELGVRPVAVELADGSDLADNLARVAEPGEWLASLLADATAAAEDEPTGEKLGTDEPSAEPERGGVSLTWAADVSAQRPRWVWQDRLPEGAVSLLVGRGGLGKSQLLADVTAHVTRGTLAGDLHGQPSRVLVASAEDAQAQVLVPRLCAAGADLSRVAFLDGFSLPDSLDGLATRVAETAARLVVIDPLVAYIPSEHSTHRDQHVRRVLAPLAALAAAHGAAVVGVVHLNKGQDREVLDRVGGSVGLGAAARSVLLLARDPDDEAGERGAGRVLAHAKSNYGRLAPSVELRIEAREIVADDGSTIETSRAVLVGEHGAEAGELLTAPTAEERSERDDAREFLEAALAGDPRPAKDVIAAAKAQGIGRTTIYRARAALGVRSVQIGGGADDQRSAWALPIEAPSQPSDEGAASQRETERGTQLSPSYVSDPPDVGRSSATPVAEPNTYVPPSLSESSSSSGGTEVGGATSHVPPGSCARGADPSRLVPTSSADVAHPPGNRMLSEAELVERLRREFHARELSPEEAA